MGTNSSPSKSVPASSHQMLTKCRYMKVMGFEQIERESGTKMKSANTVTEKWPVRLKLRRDQRGAQEEFDAVMACHHNALICYVEWKRVTGSGVEEIDG